MRPCRSWSTCSAVVVLGRPERLALGAARGRPAASISARATGCTGKRTATVFSPAVTSAGMAGAFSRIMVRGPGQKAERSFFARSGTWRTTPGSWERSLMWTMSGLSAGRPFAAKTERAALGFVASAARP